jgi:arylsulfatase A-like enzyme
MTKHCAFRLIACLFGGVAAPAAATGPATDGRPNVLVIIADDLGYSDLGCYGGEIHTPHLDRLATSGVRFRNFHNVSRCSPTRMSLLSGLHPQQVMTDPAAGTPPARPEGNVFLSEILAAAGYRTFMAGKWHLGAEENQCPWRRGFEHVFAPAAIGTGTIDYWNATAWKLTSPGDVAPPEPRASGFYSTDAIGDHAVAFLDAHQRRAETSPFFLYVAFNAPHFYLSAPRDLVEAASSEGRSYVNIYSEGWDQVRDARHRRMLAIGAIPRDCPPSPRGDVIVDGNPPASRSVPAWSALPPDRRADLARRMAVYAAAVERLDDAVGRIVGRLDETGVLDDTLVLFLSDNGGCAEGGVFGWARRGDERRPLTDHTPLTGADLVGMGGPDRDDRLSLGGGWAVACNTPFRFYKQQTHEGGIRTPLIVRWPHGHISGGHWIDQNGHVIDILPTVLAATDCEYPKSHGGHDLPRPEGMNLLAACRGAPSMPRTLGYEHLGNRAWVDGDWKLVTKNFASADDSSPADAIELYDIASDPTESHDVAAGEPERVRAMAAAWNEWAARVGVSPGRLIPENRLGRRTAP